MVSTFGNIVFEVSDGKVRTWSSFSRKGDAKYAEHALIGRKPILEFVGLDAEKVDLQIRLDAGLGVNPTKEIQALREMRDRAKSHRLIVSGVPLGKFV